MAAKQGVKTPITSIYEKDEGKTYDISASTILREWVESALKRGSLEQKVGPETAKQTIDKTDKKILENLISRIDEVE